MHLVKGLRMHLAGGHAVQDITQSQIGLSHIVATRSHLLSTCSVCKIEKNLYRLKGHLRKELLSSKKYLHCGHL